jgi:hypothetical protein
VSAADDVHVLSMLACCGLQLLIIAGLSLTNTMVALQNCEMGEGVGGDKREKTGMWLHRLQLGMA